MWNARHKQGLYPGGQRGDRAVESAMTVSRDERERRRLWEIDLIIFNLAVTIALWAILACIFIARGWRWLSGQSRAGRDSSGV
jgi:hypothetical protein